MTDKTPNRLINAHSPYLLQHAYNPVDWHEWNTETLQIAQETQKLLVVSIGYSACHWCHVMEHESFENYEVAEVMNTHFINIKVDREERPDIDQIYMYAIQLMRGSGGWPLNCICLPNGKPIYGGTYFKKDDWINILLQLSKLWKENPDEAIKYADKLSQGIQQIEAILPQPNTQNFTWTQIEEIINPWKRNFDMTYGGYTRAPKFPMPNNWQFLLRYAAITQDLTVHHAVLFTLQKMALGGIYDSIAGGFARYSVDERWHIPHFEKMLYDNAQLISLYSEAYTYSKIPLFRQIVKQSISWIKEELYSPEGLFYSALDADSEGVEGKYYTWTQKEINTLLEKNDAQIFSSFFGITEEGNWHEEQTNVLMALYDFEEAANLLQITVEQLHNSLDRSREILQTERRKRIAPGLDYKIITAWNGLMIKALCDSYKAFGEEKDLEMACKAASLFAQDAHSGLKRIYQKQEICAFLDDYACLIEAFIAVYECTFDEKWLQYSLSFTEYVIKNFGHENNALFYYTHQQSESLIARKCEITDNVIPSSNSIMAHNLQKLALYFGKEDFERRYQNMLKNTFHLYKSYGSAYSNWISLALQDLSGCYEIALSGTPSETIKKNLFKHYIPYKIYLGNTPSTLPLLRDKAQMETKIYICKNKTCSLPFDTIKEAMQSIHNGNSFPQNNAL